MCSYNSPTFLFQPIELISLAAIARNQGFNVELIDAIAESLTSQGVINVLSRSECEYIVCLSGFECIGEDLEEIKIIKSNFPEKKIILFGHYATTFKEDLMRLKTIDFIISGEPDLIFQDFMLHLKSEKEIHSISGLSYRNNKDEIIHNQTAGRIINPNELPIPAFDLLKNHLYGEPFYPKPYGLIQSARGCPFQCNFCVKSYGTKLTMLTPENIILQIQSYIQLFNLKSFRFIDDTFTAVPSRVISFCKLLISNNIKLKWSCLVRPDTLDEDMLIWMKKAGCSRLYIGVESGSQSIINLINKNFDVNLALKNCRTAKKIGFELMGFFMVGHPNESLNDVKKSLKFALDGKFSFIVVSTLRPYPGTALFNELKDEIEFSLLPYRNIFKKNELTERANLHQKYLIRNFYFHPNVWVRISKQILNDPLGIIENVKSFLRYLINKNVKTSRKDYI
jgi:anaerobic magnesium-protoporphyrin IX monomethyl ester cyclase